MSGIFSTLLVAGAVLSLVIVSLDRTLPNGTRIGGFISGIICIGSLVGASLYAQRGYRVTQNALKIDRWIGSKVFPLDNSAYAERIDDQLIRDTIRLFGLGGLFGYFGTFYNRTFGKCSMAASRRSYQIAVRNGKRVIVVTPDEPERFIVVVNERQ